MQHLLFSTGNSRNTRSSDIQGAAEPVEGLGIPDAGEKRDVALAELVEEGSVDGRTLPLVVFGVGLQLYAIPVAAVERVLPMVAVAPLPDAPSIALGAVNVEGRLLAVLDLQRRLGLPARELGPSARLLVATTSQRTVALPVDEVLGVTEVAADEIVAPDAVLPGLSVVAGIAVVGDGVALIHDLEAFLSLEQERALQEALEAVVG
jgi:purine-binding chemotaxis protein CheW